MICELARPTDNKPETRYVKGETRYMKIQKPGSAVEDARTLRMGSAQILRRCSLVVRGYVEVAALQVEG